jgi:nicotinamidase-related amidase
MLIFVDVQGRLMPHIDGHEHLLQRVTTLVRAADLLDVPVLVTEQNPRGLGATVDGLLSPRHRVIEKQTFDATLNEAFMDALPSRERVALWVAGAETHVCVLLTVLGLLGRGYRVELVADAAGSRRPADKAIALERAKQEGTRLTTVETTVFGWLKTCEHPRFREALGLIK